jgi:hypothetical protein
LSREIFRDSRKNRTGRGVWGCPDPEFRLPDTESVRESDKVFLTGSKSGIIRLAGCEFGTFRVPEEVR